MIWIDPLFDTTPFTKESTPRCFRNTLASHMGSTLRGAEGTRELVAFARKLGLRASWLQHSGRPTEHFDLTEGKRALAVRLGAKEVTSRRAAELNEEKAEGNR